MTAVERPNVMVELFKWLREETFSIEVLEWSWEKCQEFPIDENPAEHKLEWTMYHKEYQKIFEERADLFLRNHGLEADNVISAVARWQEEVEEADEVFHGLVASVDYVDFVRYMQGCRRRRKWVETTIIPNSDSMDWKQVLKLAMRHRVDLSESSEDEGGLGVQHESTSKHRAPELHDRARPAMLPSAHNDEEPELLD